MLLGATVKAITLLFALLAVGVGSAQSSSGQVKDPQVKDQCALPLYIQASQATAPGTPDNTVSLFLYGLRSAVALHQGCIVQSVSDAHLGLYITTLKLMNESGPSDASVVAVTLAVPLNGIPVYMDDYVLVLRDSDSIDGQVNALLQSIGETLDRHSSPGQ